MDQELKTEKTDEALETSAPASDKEYEELVRENQAVLGDENLAADDEASDGEAAPADDKDVTIAALQSQLSSVIEQSKSDRDEMLRQVAEAINGRKRAEAEVERVRKFALESFVKALLPVVDALDRALEVSDRNDPALKPTLEGVESTMQLFLKELGGFGVERINPVGEVFDPNVHQAIAMAESAEVAPNHVLSVMQKGFLLNGRVVRPAMVIVAKAPAKPADEAQGGNQINIEA